MTQEGSKDAITPRARRCPICGKPAVAEFRAFCSRRCADVDLNRWLSGVYAVPGKADEEEDGGPAPEGEGEGETEA
ncbi:MAG TPA: DNA gyrase inhibitor YacG [Xanthobacteraceae bacterium]|jgi:hypothetical protein|nr:DNA gyrase inhibitor YacG [Xanthobacteraceae bacterium]